MKFVGRHRYWLALVLAALAAGCSNGTGSVADRPAAPSTATPPSAPAPIPAPPESPPPVAEPAPTPTPQPPAPEPPAPPPPAPPAAPTGSALAGFWEGRAFEGDDDDDRDAKPAIAFIDQFGQAQLIVGSDADPELVLHGNICCEMTLSESVIGLRFDRTGGENVELQIGLSGGRLVGEFNYRGKHRFELASSPAYSQPLTLQGLAGVYTHTDTFLGFPSTLTLSISSSGELTGAHSNGCTYTGSVSSPNPQRNMARLDVQLSSCGGFPSRTRWNGNYQGLALQRGNVLYHSLVGPTWLGAQSVVR